MLAQVRSAVKQAFTFSAPFQTSVVLTQNTTGAFDTYTGQRSVTTTTQTINALLGEIKTDYENGHAVTRTSIYFDDSVLALSLNPQDTATFNGGTWIIENQITETLPQFVAGFNVRLP